MKKSRLTAMLIASIICLFACCTSSFSANDELKGVIPQAPAGISADNSVSGVSIVWSPVKDVAGYKIYRSASSEEFKELASVKGYAQNSYVDKSAVSGKNYSYMVCAYNAFNEGEKSDECEAICLKQPVVLSVKNAQNGIELKWEKSSGAEGYSIYKKIGSKHKKIATVKGEGKTGFIDKDVKEGESYTYRIASFKNAFKSASSQKKSPEYIKAPVLKNIANKAGAVKIEWKTKLNATGYIVYRKTDSSKWVKISELSRKESTFTDKTVENGVNYTYTVKAKGENTVSGYDKTGLSIRYIKAPSLKSAANYSNSIVVKWEKIPGAESYIVYRKTSNSDWSKLATPENPTVADFNIKNGVEYFYTVKAVDGNNVKSGYNAKGIKCLALKSPENLKAEIASKAIKISWSKAASAEQYILYKKTGNEKDWSRLAVLNKNTCSFTDSGVKKGVTYSYTVKQISGSFKGSYDSEGVKVTYVTPPNISLAHSPKGIFLKWDKAAKGAQYSIERKTDGEAWATVATVKNTDTVSYTHKNPEFQKLNYYRVKAIYPNGTVLVSPAKSIYGIDPKKPMVALTYDDGPYTPVTNKVLDTLEKYNSRATFFIVGSRASTYKDCLKRSVSLGCEIGNHSYNHTILTSVGAETIKSEINATNKVVKEITGVSPKIVRTPGGAVNSTVRSSVGYPMFNWSVDTLDWKHRNSSSVISNIKANVKDGSIVLMHDLYTSTGAATEEIVPWLIKEGYQLVTVSELMAVKGINVKAGSLYYNAY